MKAIKSIIGSAVLILLISVSAMSQSDAKVIAVINKASWCPVCQKNGERAMNAFMSNNKDMAIKFVSNDLTNAETKKKSTEEIKKLGLEKEVAENSNATGVAYFYNSKTKALISEVSLAKSDQELAAALTNAKAALKQ